MMQDKTGKFESRTKSKTPNIFLILFKHLLKISPYILKCIKLQSDVYNLSWHFLSLKISRTVILIYQKLFIGSFFSLKISNFMLKLDVIGINYK